MGEYEDGEGEQGEGTLLVKRVGIQSSAGGMARERGQETGMGLGNV